MNVCIINHMCIYVCMYCVYVLYVFYMLMMHVSFYVVLFDFMCCIGVINDDDDDDDDCNINADALATGKSHHDSERYAHVFYWQTRSRLTAPRFRLCTVRVDSSCNHVCLQYGGRVGCS